jgi:hypothetical protein
MSQSIQEFTRRMRTDRAFRRNILAAKKAGSLAETLAKEGWEIDLNLLDGHLPQVRTGIRAGAHESGTDCYCLI